MARLPYKFEDPKTGNSYQWQINPSPDGEEPFGISIPITHQTSTGGQPLWQQGDRGPLVRKMKGVILEHAQLQQFLSWFALSQAQTIYFTDAFGDKYEVQITGFLPQLKGVALNPRDRAHPRIWNYTMELTVYKALAGDLVGIA